VTAGIHCEIQNNLVKFITAFAKLFSILNVNDVVDFAEDITKGLNKSPFRTLVNATYPRQVILIDLSFTPSGEHRPPCYDLNGNWNSFS
jgi:hypothetical protein